MKNQDIENKLDKAIESCTPDVIETVLASCNEQKPDAVLTAVTSRKNRLKKAVVACAAAAAIILGGVFSYGFYKNNYDVDSVIGLDVNPSIELKTNKNDKVIDVLLLNGDAEKILENMDLKGSHLNVAVNAIIGSMVKNGYISELQNSVLISVDNADEQKGKMLEERLMNEINEILKSSSVKPSVLGQTKSADSEIGAIAKEYKISYSKAQLIKDITTDNPLYSAAELAKLNINELNVLISSGRVAVSGVDTEGTASTKAYIKQKKALEIALNHAGVKRSQVDLYEVDFDCDDGKMVYDVEFTADGFEFEYEIDAVNGKILNFEKEQDDNDRQDFEYSETKGQNTKPIESTKGQNQKSPKTTKNSALKSTKSTGKQDKNSVKIEIGREKAKSIALKDAGLDNATVYDFSCEKDFDDGLQVYEISFEHSGYEYEYEIDAVSGKIIDKDKEKED